RPNSPRSSQVHRRGMEGGAQDARRVGRPPAPRSDPPRIVLPDRMIPWGGRCPPSGQRWALPTIREEKISMTDATPDPPHHDPKRRRGLILVNTGDGKGKTTAALGLAFRALGSGFKVFMVQYIKGKWKTGEKKMADRLAPEIEIRPMGDGFTWVTQNRDQDVATTMAIWEVSKEAIASGRYDLVILAGIKVVMKRGYPDPAPVIEVLKARDPRLHVVLTGRGAPPEIVEAADLVTEMVPIKHPYKSGVKAQQGIEF